MPMVPGQALAVWAIAALEAKEEVAEAESERFPWALSRSVSSRPALFRLRTARNWLGQCWRVSVLVCGSVGADGAEITSKLRRRDTPSSVFQIRSTPLPRFPSLMVKLQS